MVNTRLLVAESLVTFKYRQASVGATICLDHVQLQAGRGEDHDTVHCYSEPDARGVAPGRLRFLERNGGNDTTYAAECNHDGGGECALALRSDVRLRPAQNERTDTIRPSASKLLSALTPATTYKDTKVSGSLLTLR